MPKVDATHFSLQVGSKPVYRNKATASVSLSSPYLGVPYAYIHKLVAAIGAEYSFKLDLYTVDCKKVDDLPPIILVVGQGFTYTWNVLPRDYVVNKVRLTRFLDLPLNTLLCGPLPPNARRSVDRLVRL